MDTRTIAAATRRRGHHTVFTSLTLPPKHSTNFVLFRTPINNLEHPCHCVGFQTALNPMVSLTNLLTVLLRHVPSNATPLVIHMK